MRSEGEAILDGFAEALEISTRSGARLHLYHLKAAGAPAWPKMATLIERINAEKAAGKDIHADMYLYTAGGTGLAASCPPWASEDDLLKERLRDPETRARIRAAMLEPDGSWEPLGSLAGPEGVYPVGLSLPEHAEYRGKSLAEIAGQRGQDWIDTVLDLIEAEPEGVGTLYHLMTEDNIQLQLKEPWVMLGSDAAGYDPGDQDGRLRGRPSPGAGQLYPAAGPLRARTGADGPGGRGAPHDRPARRTPAPDRARRAEGGRFCRRGDFRSGRPSATGPPIPRPTSSRWACVTCGSTGCRP